MMKKFTNIVSILIVFAMAGCSSRSEKPSNNGSDIQTTESINIINEDKDIVDISEDVYQLLSLGDFEGATSLLSPYVKKEDKEAKELLEYVLNEKKLYTAILKVFNPKYTLADEITANFYEPTDGEQLVIIVEAPESEVIEYMIQRDNDFAIGDKNPRDEKEKEAFETSIRYLNEGKIIEKKFDLSRVVHLFTSEPQIGMPKEIVENSTWPGHKAEKKETVTAEGSTEVWTYGYDFVGKKVIFTDGRVSEIVK
jgi:hypothetical protein